MAVPAFSGTVADRDIAEINITPLVDVMLVLLIIFMVAAPALTRRIDVDLPQPARTAPATAVIRLRIEPSGELRWNGAHQPLSALEALMAVEAQRASRDRAPLLQIDASGEADYGLVARVMAAARNAGLERVAFVSR